MASQSMLVKRCHLPRHGATRTSGPNRGVITTSGIAPPCMLKKLSWSSKVADSSGRESFSRRSAATIARLSGSTRPVASPGRSLRGSGSRSLGASLGLGRPRRSRPLPTGPSTAPEARPAPAARQGVEREGRRVFGEHDHTFQRLRASSIGTGSPFFQASWALGLSPIQRSSTGSPAR